MEGWMMGWVCATMNEWMGERMDGMNGCMDGRMKGGWEEGRKYGGWMEGLKD